MVNILLPLIIAAVAIVLLIIKTNATYVFFALCSGNVLVQFASKNMAYVNGHLNKKLLPHGYIVSKPVILLVLLFLPPILVASLSKHNNGPSKWPVHVLPAVASGILSILFVVPLLSLSTQNSLTQNKFWSLLEQYQIPIVILCIAVSVVILILTTYGNGHITKKHHKE